MSDVSLLVIDFALWSVISLTISKIAYLKSDFETFSAVFKPKAFERDGQFYQDVFQIKRWKSRLPDGARLFKGAFSKARIHQTDVKYLKQFAYETKRGEWAHWLQLGCAPFFTIWNPPRLIIVMICYALIANLPCIIVQRYNRLVLDRIIAKSRAIKGSARDDNRLR